MSPTAAGRRSTCVKFRRWKRCRNWRGVTHDFNNILCAILMQIEFLREDPWPLRGIPGHAGPDGIECQSRGQAPPAASRLQPPSVATMHRAKGLEFDKVVLLAPSAQTGRRRRQQRPAPPSIRGHHPAKEDGNGNCLRVMGGGDVVVGPHGAPLPSLVFFSGRFPRIR